MPCGELATILLEMPMAAGSQEQGHSETKYRHALENETRQSSVQKAGRKHKGFLERVQGHRK